MALFFDSDWFNQRLKEKNSDKKDFAKALGITLQRLESVWKDQSQLTPAQAEKVAAFLNQPIAEVIKYAGIASVEKPALSQKQGIDAQALLTKLDSIERRLITIENLLMAQNIVKND